MSVVTTVLVFLLAVVVTAFTARLLPVRIPLPILQIGAGAMLATFGFQATFEPQVFLLLFIPPLLFLDGWRIPKGAFFRDWKPILALAIGLVIFTVVGIGWLVTWLIPAIPVAVAFALAAILSPTDPVSVSAATAATPLPARVTHLLEGESLLNDATGLVCFSFAVTAAVTGQFSLAEASLSFVKVAGGGLLVGLVVTGLIGRANRWLVRRAGEEPGIQILVSLLMPFAAYLAAEQFHFSGILAAAAAGLAMHYGEFSGKPLAATRMQRTAVWDTVHTALTGTIFVLLGAQLPALALALPEVAANTGGNTTLGFVADIVLITAALMALRFAWVWVSIRLTLFHAAKRGERLAPPPTRLVAAMAVAGVRGAITLAGILTLPVLLPDGAAFPAREAAISIAVGVILLSLLVASFGLPLLASNMHGSLPEPVKDNAEAHARLVAAEAALHCIDTAASQPLSDAVVEASRAQAIVTVRDVYQRQIDYGDASGEAAQEIARVADAERTLRIAALRAERDALFRLHRSLAIDDELHRNLVHEIDLHEERLTVASRP